MASNDLIDQVDDFVRDHPDHLSVPLMLRLREQLLALWDETDELRKDLGEDYRG